MLSDSKELWASYRESHYLWERYAPDYRDPYFSTVMKAEDFKPEDLKFIENQYHKYTYNSFFIFGYLSRVIAFRKTLRPLFELWSQLIKIAKSLFLKDYRVLDKTPPNTYRIEYLKKAFPDAKFIYLTRDGKTNISSLIDAWRTKTGKWGFAFRKFYDYKGKLKIKGYDGDVWKFTNPPGWEDYMDKPLEEVCAFQWLSAHEFSLNSFSKMNPDDFIQVRYEDLTSNPADLIKKICDFAEIEFSGDLKKVTEELPQVSQVSKPNPDKWMKNKEMIERILPKIKDMQEKLGYECSLV